MLCIVARRNHENGLSRNVGPCSQCKETMLCYQIQSERSESGLQTKHGTFCITITNFLKHVCTLLHVKVDKLMIDRLRGAVRKLEVAAASQ